MRVLQNLLKFSLGVLGYSLVLTNTALASDTELRIKIVAETDTGYSGRGDTPEMNLLQMNATESELRPIPTDIQQGTPTLNSSVPILEELSQYTEEASALEQVTSVSQLSDISPDDWAFQALQSLVERYGCITGYPDGTYRGNRTLTRYEFAAGLNACLNQINTFIASRTADSVTKEDLTTLQRLQEEFSAELIAVKGQLDSLDARTNKLEVGQFSPTAELEGEVILAAVSVNGGKKADGSGEPVENNLTLSDRVRLTFETSFTGKDELQFRLQARNIPELEDATGTKMANLGFDGDDDNELEVDEMEYRFPLGDNTRVYLSVVGIGLGDLIPTVSPLFSGSSEGSISTFGRENPIRRQGDGAGIGISHNFGKTVNLSLGYIASDPADPEVGLFSGPYGASAQLIWQPSEALGLSFTYVRSYNSFSTGTGSILANEPFDGDADSVSANSFGAEASVQITPTVTLGGRVGLIQAQAEDLPNQPEADIFTWAVLLALPDLGREGNVAGIVIGQPPKVINNDFGTDYEDKDTSLHLEAFYRFQVTDDIAITPGLFVITNPEHNDNNDTVYIGTIRTTFTF